MGTTAKSKSGQRGAGRRRLSASAASARRARRKQAAVVNKLMEMFEAKVDGKELKATLSDFIRLLQLQKELEDEQPREIKVTWVEPEAGPSSGS